MANKPKNDSKKKEEQKYRQEQLPLVSIPLRVKPSFKRPKKKENPEVVEYIEGIWEPTE